MRPRTPASRCSAGTPSPTPSPSTAWSCSGSCDPDPDARRTSARRAGRHAVPHEAARARDDLHGGQAGVRHRRAARGGARHDDDAQRRRRGRHDPRSGHDAATDVTGFGLMGHLLEDARAPRASRRASTPAPCPCSPACWTSPARRRGRGHQAQPRVRRPRHATGASCTLPEQHAAGRRADERRLADRHRRRHGARGRRWPNVGVRHAEIGRDRRRFRRAPSRSAAGSAE